MKTFSEVSWRNKYPVEQLEQILRDAFSAAASTYKEKEVETIAIMQDKPMEVIQGLLEVKGAFSKCRKEH